MQVTVIFLVDVDKCLPNKDDWPQLWAQQQAWKQAKKDHEDELVGPHQQKPGTVLWHDTTQRALCSCVSTAKIGT